MTGSTTPAEETVTATVEFSVLGTTLHARLTVPVGPTKTSELLPTCRILSGAIVDAATDEVRGQGQQVSCKAGCGACCRQVVPVSEPEARVLTELVERMDEPRRSIVKKRFEDGRRRLADSGLLEKLDELPSFAEEDVQRYATDYFHLGIACPFLEDESCSIYEERPLICREYLVTSPPEECARPNPDTIKMVPMPARVSSALIRVGLPPGAKQTRWVPLLLAPEWAAAHPDEACERTGPQLVEELFANLAERRRGQSAAQEAPDAAAEQA